MMRYILTIFFLAISVAPYAQERPIIDSLENLLRKQDDDSLKIRILERLSWQYVNHDARKAINLAKQAVSLALTLDNNMLIARSYDMLGVAYSTYGNYDSSGLALNTGLKYAQAAKLPYEISIMLMHLGINHHSQTEYTIALEYYFKALEVAEKHNLPKQNLYGNIAIVYNTVSNYRTALHYDSLAIREAEKQNSSEARKLLILGNMASTLSGLGKFDLAAEMLRESIAYYKKTNERFYLSGLYKTLAEIEVKQRKYAEAFSHFSQALALNKEIGNWKEISTAYNNLGSLELRRKNINSAKQFALKAYHISDSLRFYDDKRDASNLLAKIAIYNHDLAMSTYYDSITDEVTDSIDLKEQAKVIAELKMKYETQKKEKENEVLREVQIRQASDLLFQRYTIVFIVLILATVMTLLFVVHRSNHNAKKQNELLQQKNTAIELQQEKILAQKNEISIQNVKLQTTLDELRITQAQLIHAEKMASLGQMTAGIAHEINNPLNYISGSVSSLNLLVGDLVRIARERKDSASVPSANLPHYDPPLEDIEHDIPMLMENISNGVKRVTKIISGLLTFSSPITDAPATANIHECLETVLLLMKSKLEAARIAVDLRFDKSLPLVRGGKVQLEQVFVNIVDNAIHAMAPRPENNKLIITTQVAHGKVVISIRDTGPGIPASYQTKVMEPFFTTKPVGQGTGLGLSISYGIINTLGGELTFTSEEGKGTEFRIILCVAVS